MRLVASYVSLSCLTRVSSLNYLFGVRLSRQAAIHHHDQRSDNASDRGIKQNSKWDAVVIHVFMKTIPVANEIKGQQFRRGQKEVDEGMRRVVVGQDSGEDRQEYSTSQRMPNAYVHSKIATALLPENPAASHMGGICHRCGKSSKGTSGFFTQSIGLIDGCW